MDNNEQMEKSNEKTGTSFQRNDERPLYEQVAAWLLEQVTSGQWPMHHMLPPEIPLAEELGVSRITLRRAMSELVEQGIFIRISGRGTFVAMQDQQVLQEAIQKVSLLKPVAEQETRLVGVVVPSTTSPFVSGILAHLEHALYERGYRMLLTNSHDSLSQQGEHLRQLVEFGVAGIILYSGSFLHDQTVHMLLRRKIPLVMLDRYYPALEKQVSIVTSDHARGGYLLTEYLLRLGHRRIGFLLGTTEVVTSTLARFEGYKTALKDYGVEFAEELVMQAQIAEETVQTYLKRAKEPSAIFASNDTRAIEFAHVLHKLAIHVPTDLSVVGFDDVPLVSRLNPPLTTMSQSVHQLGEASAHLLLDIIEGKVNEPQKIVIPTELIVRQSCTSYPASTMEHAQSTGTEAALPFRNTLEAREPRLNSKKRRTPK